MPHDSTRRYCSLTSSKATLEANLWFSQPPFTEARTVTKTRRTLTDAEQSAANRLKAIYKHEKEFGRAGNKKITYESIAEAAGWPTVNVVGQYIIGRIPINLEAACKFATYLGVAVGDISPELEALLPPKNRKPHKKCPVCHAGVDLTDKQSELLGSLVKEMAPKKELTWTTL
jgi:transcriptional regulator with XRE-family HTH domain